MAQQHYSTVIFGCGNAIMGDDGFGPAVIDELKTHYSLPETVSVVDAGTGVREYLFDYLLMAEGRPEKVIIVDAVDFHDRAPGEVFLIDTAAIPAKKIHDFSLHQFPTVNLLQELENHTGVQVSVLAAQVESIPSEIQPGLSKSIQQAIPLACNRILHILSGQS